jgi:hypothetical protein
LRIAEGDQSAATRARSLVFQFRHFSWSSYRYRTYACENQPVCAIYHPRMSGRNSHLSNQQSRAYDGNKGPRIITNRAKTSQSRHLCHLCAAR